jgi:methionine synthase II (cobalamin-independent)
MNGVSLTMFTPFLTTGIGSLPHTDREEACRLVLETFDIPFWPQLPKVSFRESMIAQFSEGLPFLKIDEERETVWIEREGGTLTKFYETYTEDTELAVSDRFATGFSAFINTIKDNHFAFLKGHVTGPMTFSLGLKDSYGRLVYFDEELREIALMLLKAKIRWQIKTLTPYAEQVIIFIDEPVLSALGSSSYIGVDPQEALRLLRETSDAVKNAGGIPGIHCCSKADWPLVINSGVSIISFDAFDYIETISLYPGEFTGFLKNGGYLAWGIVPTTEAIRDENAESVKRRFDTGIETLSKSIPADLLLSKILLTPSCGTGSRSIEETEKVFSILNKLKKLIKGSSS